MSERPAASMLSPARALLVLVAIQLALPGKPAAQTAAAPIYRLEDWQGTAGELRARFSETQLGVLEKINRCDVRCLQRLRGSLVVAEPLDADELAVSPFPPRWQGAEQLRKAVVVHVPWQAFGAYENGSLIRWGPVSSGRQTRQTPPGLYHLNWRSPGRHSTVNPDWFMRWYFNIDNKRGISMHAFALPGRPASHACVRMLDRDARWLFDWGEEWQLDESRTRLLRHGTPVLIVGRYDFAGPPPWQSMELLKRGIELPPDPWTDEPQWTWWSPRDRVRRVARRAGLRSPLHYAGETVDRMAIHIEAGLAPYANTSAGWSCIVGLWGRWYC